MIMSDELLRNWK